MEKREDGLPGILDLGKRKQKSIRQLKKGGGPLLKKIEAVIAQARSAAPAGTELLPVVFIYRKKGPRARKGLAMVGPF
jgi:hypothetical protein